jgi:hypothetical protein
MNEIEISSIYSSIICILYTVCMLILWFEGDITNFIQKVLFNIKLFKREEYEQYMLSEDAESTYPDFLYEKYPSFFTKLISCPICLSFWLTIIHTVLIFKSNSIYILPISYLSTLILYLISKKLIR